MSTNHIVRCAFIVAIAYVSWQVLLPLCNLPWTITITVLALLTFSIVLAIVFVLTGGGAAHRSPSAVRDRIKENIARQRARLPQ